MPPRTTCLCLLLAGSAAHAQMPAATSNEAPSPSAVVWAYPLSTPFFGAIALSRLVGPVWQIPIGANFSVGPDWSLAIEAAFTRGTVNDACSTCLLWGVTAAIGPSWSVSGRGLEGWFVQPKFLIGYAEPRGWGIASLAPSGEPLAFSPTRTVDFQLGIDVGYHLRFGRLYMAPVMGASAGWCIDCGGPFASGALGPNAQQRHSFVAGLNVNLLRLGAIF